MKLHLPNTLLFFLITGVLSGCSSNDNDPSDNENPGDSLQNDSTTIMDAGNFDSVLTASMDILRADVYKRSAELMDQLSTQWEPYTEAALGTVLQPCPGGGTVNRQVTEISDFSAGVPDLKLTSELEFTDCIIGDTTLNGEVKWNKSQSSLAQMGSTSHYDDYEFEKLSVKQADVNELVTGSFSQDIGISGPGDAYVRQSTTLSYQKTQGASTISLSNANYKQEYSHFIAQQTLPNGVDHSFTETGNGTINIDSLALIDAVLSIEPELVYANDIGEQTTLHTDVLASGGISLAIPGDSSLDMTVASVENATVTYTLTDANGQKTTIEREWVAPTVCLPDSRFQYDSCF